MIPLFHPDYRTPDYAAQLRDLPHDIAGLSAQNAKPIGDPALFDKSIEVVHELIQRNIISRYGRGATSAARAAADEGQLARQLSDSLLRLSSNMALQPEPEAVDSQLHSSSSAASSGGGSGAAPAAAAPVVSAKMQQMLRDRIHLLQTTATTTHIISCPFGNPEGVAAAKAVSDRYANRDAVYCYYPNEDCPQDPAQQGGEKGRAESWLKVHCLG